MGGGARLAPSGRSSVESGAASHSSPLGTGGAGGCSVWSDLRPGRAQAAAGWFAAPARVGFLGGPLWRWVGVVWAPSAYLVSKSFPIDYNVRRS